MPTSSGFQVNEVLTASNTNTYLLRPFTNCIMNPAMAIAQRGTTATGLNTFSQYGTVDRWLSSMSATGVWTQTQQTLTSSDAPLQDGVRNSFRVTCTTANASLAGGAFALLAQGIEGLNVQHFAKGTTNARPFALSFWVRATKTGVNAVELFDANNNRTVSAVYTIAASNQWQKVRLVFPSDLTGVFFNDTATALGVHFWFAAGSAFTSGTLQTAWATTNNPGRAVGQVNHADAVNNFFEITGVQLEPNNVCTPFERRLHGTELQLCQRYFFRVSPTPQYEPVAASGVNAQPTGHWRTTTVLPVPMRKALVTADISWGTLVAYDGLGLVFVTAGAVVGHSANGTMLQIDWSSGGNLTTGRPVVILTQPSVGFFQVSADL